MEAKVALVTSNELEIEVEDEDVSIGQIVENELLKDRQVVFAGLVTPHPLLKRMVIKVQTKGVGPIKALRASISKASESVGELMEEAEKAFKSK